MAAAHGTGETRPVNAGGRYRWQLTAAFALVGTFFVVELVAGLVSDSLALISDAGHMLADVIALGAALVATALATRRDKSGRRTFGYYRAEVFASGFVVLLMLGVSVYVVVEAIGRIGAEVEVASTTMLVVGALGLVVNAVTMVLLRAGSKKSLNVKAAYYEVIADAAGSVGVIVAGVLIVTTGLEWWDTAVALAIGVFVAVRAVVLGRQVLSVLGQNVPKGMELETVVGNLGAVRGVSDVHDLHIWTLTSGMNVATAHLVTDGVADPQRVLTDAQAVLLEEHRIEHATLQVETVPTRQCHEVSW